MNFHWGAYYTDMQASNPTLSATLVASWTPSCTNPTHSHPLGVGMRVGRGQGVLPLGRGRRNMP